MTSLSWKFFGISTRPGKVFVPVQLYWDFPVVGWIKVNTNDTTWGSPSLAACAGILRASHGENIGGFSALLRNQNALSVDIMGALLAIEQVQRARFIKLLLESDSILLYQAFSSAKGSVDS